MSSTKTAVLYIDDTGKVGDGAWVGVDLIIDTDETAEWETVVEKCRGEKINTESATNQSLNLSGTLKFRRSSAILQRFVAAFLAADDAANGQIGVWNCTGDNTVEGNQGWQMNAMVKSMGRPMPDGDYIKYAVTMVPNAANADTTLPQFVTVPPPGP